LLPSTEYLTAAQTAARLGIKPQTLYAYVSRGQLARHRAPDGRTSLFSVGDVTRLEKRRGARGGAPSDITVASELTLVDKADGRLWFRGLDAVAACRQRSFEEIASWLWTASLEPTLPWRAETRALSAAKRAQSALGKGALPSVRLPLIASALAAHGWDDPFGPSAAAGGLGGRGAAGGGRPTREPTTPVGFAERLGWKLGAGANVRVLLDPAMSLLSEHGLTYPTLAVRLTVAAGGGIAEGVASAMHVAAPSVMRLVVLERAFAMARDTDPVSAAGALGADAIDAASWKEPYRSGDPRARAMLDLIREHKPEDADTVDAFADELRVRGAPPPTAEVAIAALSWTCGMAPGSAAAISLVSRTAGWIAHAIEEHRRPTPYRPRLAYTGPPPRAAGPRRTLDAVQDYLARS
jgi:citrate synthase